MATTDRGVRSESALFQILLTLRGCSQIRTTAGGMAEYLHGLLKTTMGAVVSNERGRPPILWHITAEVGHGPPHGRIGVRRHPPTAKGDYQIASRRTYEDARNFAPRTK
ncbi:hypothetical protein SprV_0702369000 [Sparganum proliferum]